MGQANAAATEAPTRDKRDPSDVSWPIFRCGSGYNHLAFVKGLPYFREESSENLAEYRCYILESDDPAILLPYWKAFKRDYDRYITVAEHSEDPPTRMNIYGKMCIVFYILPAIAEKIFGY